MNTTSVEDLGYTPVHRDLPPHDATVFFVILREDSHAWGIARRRGIRWYYADIRHAEMPEAPTHWKPYP